MSLETIRQNLVTAVETAKSTFVTYPLVVEYDNRQLVDYSTQTNPFLCVEVKFIEGEQADLSSAPIHRYYGVLLLVAKGKVGSGTAKLLTLLDHFHPLLQRGSFGMTRTHMATFAPAKEADGWLGIGVVIPFRADKFP